MAYPPDPVKVVVPPPNPRPLERKRPSSGWYGSSRYDWFMLGVFVGAAWVAAAVLVWATLT